MSLISPPALVLWDAYGFDPLHGGISRYAEKLWLSLHAEGIDPLVVTPTCSEKLSFPKQLRVPLPRTLKKLGGAKAIWPSYAFAYVKKQAFWQPSCELRGSGVIFHGLANTNIPLSKSLYRQKLRRIVTIHDLIPLLPASGVSLPYKGQFRYLLPKVIAAADRVICVSEWTKTLLLDRYPQGESKTVVISHGYDGLINQQVAEGSSPQLPTAKGEKQTLLYVSRYEPYKRFALVVALARALPQAMTLQVVTNSLGEKYLRQNAAPELKRGKLQVYTALSDASLAALYQRACLYIHPSSYEGYGFPAVEALRAGTPVIFQKGNALEEVLDPSVSVAVAQGAELEAWLALIGQHQHLKDQPSFQLALSAFFQQKPSWQHAACSLKSVYNSLT